ncbi:hypothetical protein [Paenibacillus sp. Marseille-Q4541]|uniref:hypothetical protein n=1 Tax=Paenibacillus sp. Marseille-Q4541 TaxID=2831522 RepID=UPI001BAA252E|nr:hypothetical protein [Paenibacillus sp. Marseille-Q4541]
MRARWIRFARIGISISIVFLTACTSRTSDLEGHQKPHGDTVQIISEENAPSGNADPVFLPKAMIGNKVTLDYIDYDKDVVNEEDMGMMTELSEEDTNSILMWYSQVDPRETISIQQLNTEMSLQMTIHLSDRETVLISYDKENSEVYLQVHTKKEVRSYKVRDNGDEVTPQFDQWIEQGPYQSISGVTYHILLDEYLENDDPDNPDVSILHRSYYAYSQDNNSYHYQYSIALDKVANISEAKAKLAADTKGNGNSLQLLPNTLISPKVTRQWKEEGYQPSQEYSAESPAGLTYKEIQGLVPEN